MRALCKLLLVLFAFGVTAVSAQPYTLNKDLNPTKLELLDDKENEGVKYFEQQFDIKPNEVQYYYIKGHDIFQYVDIFIFANSGNPDLKAEIATTTWKEILESKSTNSTKDGIINFKARTYNAIGLIITSSDKEIVNYSIIANASKPVKDYLGSPFVKATKNNTGLDIAPNSSQEVLESKTSIWIILGFGILLLIIGLLLGKLIGKRRSTLIICLLFIFSNEAISQEDADINERLRTLEREVENIERQRGIDNTRRQQVAQSIAHLNQAFGTAEATERAISAYMNLDACMRSTPPSGQPRIPTFCLDDGNGCGSCFVNARREFNEVRYTIEKLQTIYDCTIRFTDAAIAFGDNVSGYHGVVGLTWQAERKKIMRSRAKLDKSYDDKRAELLMKLNAALLKLNECEAVYGILDWYDRFGVLFYDFVEMRYHR